MSIFAILIILILIAILYLLKRQDRQELKQTDEQLAFEIDLKRCKLNKLQYEIELAEESRAEIEEALKSQESYYNEQSQFLSQKLQKEKDNFQSAYQNMIYLQKKLYEDDKKKKEKTIKVDEAARNDIDVLLNFSKQLNNPQIIYKLIWSEYIQKPTGMMIQNTLLKKDVSGIYKITNINNNKVYIGKSVNVGERFIQHVKSALEIGTIAKNQLYLAMKEEGVWNFTFELVEECPKENLTEREKFYIQLFDSCNWGYNLREG